MEISFAKRLARFVGMGILATLTTLMLFSIFYMFNVKFALNQWWYNLSNNISWAMSPIGALLYFSKANPSNLNFFGKLMKRSSIFRAFGGALAVYLLVFMSLGIGFGGFFTHLFGKNTELTIQVKKWAIGTSRVCSGLELQHYGKSLFGSALTVICIDEEERNKFPAGTKIKAKVTASPFGIIVREYEKL